jgi:hypothetical protein
MAMKKYRGVPPSASRLKIAGDWKINRAGSSRRAMAIDSGDRQGGLGERR